MAVRVDEQRGFELVLGGRCVLQVEVSFAKQEAGGQLSRLEFKGCFERGAGGVVLSGVKQRLPELIRGSGVVGAELARFSEVGGSLGVVVGL
jgi:hypothetical protein